MNIVVCDDDKECVKKITKLLHNCINNESKIYECSNKNQVLELLITEHIDIAYLDIDLSNNDSGIELAKKIQNKNQNTLIIFITSYDDYVSDAFLLSAFQYLRKPIKDDVFYKEFYRAKEYYEKYNIKIKIKGRGITYSFNINDIIYIENYYRKVQVMTTSGLIKTTNTFNDLKKLLSEFDFVSTHQSYFVNLYYVQAIEKNHVILINGEKIDISSYKYADIQRSLNRYLNRN